MMCDGSRLGDCNAGDDWYVATGAHSQPIYAGYVST
jgi:hypothetical protein